MPKKKTETKQTTPPKKKIPAGTVSRTRFLADALLGTLSAATTGEQQAAALSVAVVELVMGQDNPPARLAEIQRLIAFLFDVEQARKSRKGTAH